MNGHDETNWRGHTAAPDGSPPESSSLPTFAPAADEGASHATASHDDLWRVRLTTGEVRLMTLDGLDRAFDEGIIDARALVLAPGSTEWTTLGAAAGLDEEVTKPELTPSLSPVAISTDEAPRSIAPLREDRPSAPLDLDLPDDDELRPRRRGLVLAAIASAAVIGAAMAVVIAKVGESVPADVKVNGAMEAPPPAEEPLPPPRPPVDEKPQLTEEQKKELLEADKAREQKARAKAQERIDKAQKTQKRARPSKKIAPGLLNGGDPHDPLNGKL